MIKFSKRETNNEIHLLIKNLAEPGIPVQVFDLGQGCIINVFAIGDTLVVEPDMQIDSGIGSWYAIVNKLKTYSKVLVPGETLIKDIKVSGAIKTEYGIELSLIATDLQGHKEKGTFQIDPGSIKPKTASLDTNPNLVDMEFEFYGCKWIDIKPLKGSMEEHPSRWNRDSLQFTNPFKTLIQCHSANGKDSDYWWEHYFKLNPVGDTIPLPGVTKQKAIKQNLDRLAAESPVDHIFFLWLCDNTTSKKVSNNQLLSAFLKDTETDYDKFKKSLRELRTEFTLTSSLYRGAYIYNMTQFGQVYLPVRREYCSNLPGAKEYLVEKEQKQEAAKQSTRHSQSNNLGIDPDQFSSLFAAVESGEIPTRVFQQVNGTPVNIEFPLWERAIRRGYLPTLSKIAKNAAARTTYERDITPFIAFCFKIEKYLERHTNKKWEAIPTFVESQWMLEMEESDSPNGTVKKRSALTPVADNENCTVTVPYVGLSVSGARTQWCYSHHYYVFEEGFTDPISGGMIADDLELKLNGRDDYGLCYYTLTGTSVSRGYPTFLIIFERLSSGTTRVHFHRAHPKRSKDKEITPACRLIQACYQYMAGNVPACDIAAQQGDLLFIKMGYGPTKQQLAANVIRGREITFESHTIVGLYREVALFENNSKEVKNRLGFLDAVETDITVRHPEHEDIKLLPGDWYEIRRCKSWEANPRAIWSVTVD